MRFTACVVLFSLLLIPAAFAQSDKGTITGTVTDPAGAMIPNAAIEAKNTQTAAVYQTASSATGNYTLAQLPVGIYQLSASVSGFKQYVRTGITVMVAQTLRVDIPLEVGSISETVTVSADAALLKTESGELSHNVTTDRVNDLPLISVAGGIRSAYAQINLLPGASTTGSGISSALRVNGAPGATLALRIEGQDATQTAWSAAMGMSQPGVDAIEETAIQTSNYAAEFGQVGGGMFNMTMRSGTNRFHGSAYEYWRNEAFNAYAPFNKPAVKPRDRRHDFGFTAGGPIWIPKVYDGRDKTFVFWTYETNRQNLTTNSIYTVPTDAYRKGDFSNPALFTQKWLDKICYAPNIAATCGYDPAGNKILDGAIYDPRTERTVTGLDGKQYVVRSPFPGNIIPSDYFAKYADPVALKLQQLLPRAQNSNAINNYTVTYPNKPVTSIHSVKADHNLNSKMKISGYWSLNNVTQNFPDGFAPPITTERDLSEVTHTVRLSYDYTMTPTVLLHLGAGVMHFVFEDPAPLQGSYDPIKELGLPGTYMKLYPTLYGLFQGQGGGMASPSGQGNNFGPVAQQQQYQTKPTATASLSWVKNNHTYKFGSEFRAESYPSAAVTPSNGFFYFGATQTALPYLQSVPGGSLGFPYASFLLGYINNGEIGQYSKFHMGKQAWSFFAQDSWKITPRLTLDYGLRYDYQTYLRETYGRVPGFGYQTPNPSYGNIPGAVVYEKNGLKYANNYPWAFGPRLGLAWQFLPKTVLRAGIGISYGQTADLEMWSLRFGSDERYSVGSYGAAEYGGFKLKDGPPITPIWPNTDPGSVPKTPGIAFMTAFDRNAGRPPRQVMWSIGIQRELTRNLSLELSYVGNRGVWWNSNGTLSDPNRVTPAILSQHNLNLSNPDDVALLTTPLSSVSAAEKTAHNLKVPFSQFPALGTVSQSLRPYPQFGGIYVLWAPLGNTWYDSLQMKLTKRFSHGLDFTAVYTWQKELTVGAETNDTAFAPVAPAINDLNDMRSNKTISGLSTPHRLVFAANYTTPSPNVSKPVDIMLRNWQIGAVLTYQSGLPIHVPFAQNGIAQALSLCAPMDVYGGCNSGPAGTASHMNRVPGQPLFTADLNSKFDPNTQFVLNPAAWSNPTPGTFGTTSAYLNDYRYRRVQNENLSLARIFRIREGMNVSIRMELMNAFNRVRIPNPSATNALAPQVRNSATGKTQSGFGYINPVSAGGQRTGQLVARFNF